MLKVVTPHSDQMGYDFFLSGCQTRKNLCLAPLVKWLRTVDSQNAHPVSNKLDSGLLCSCHLGTKKGGVTGVGEERMRGKKLGNEDPRLCNRWACFCSIIHGAVCCHWQEVAAGYDPLILSVGCTFLCSMGAHPARAYVIVLLGNRAWWVSRE